MMLLGAYVSGNAPAATDIPGGGSDRPVASWLAPDVGALDLPQELLVGLGGAHLVDHQLQRLRGLQRTEDPAQLPGHDQLLVGEQQLLLAGRGAVHVQCREDATLGELAVQPDLHVPGGLELLEDDLVHARAGVHQRGRQDRQRAAVLDVAGRSEEALGRVQGRGVDTAGQDLAAGRGGEVVGARQAGDAVEQDHHVLAVLDQTLGPLDGQLGHLAVVVARPVEGRVDHLRLGGALHVGDLFRPLVDEQDDEAHLGVVGADRVGDLLHQGGLAGLWRRHDQATLPLADRGHDVHDPRGDLRRRVLEPEPLVGVQGGEVLEVLAVAGDLGLHAVDLVDPHKRRVLLGVTGQLDHALDLVAAAQARAPDHRQRHVDVVGARQVAVDPQEAVAVLRADVERADPGHLWPVVGRRGAVARVGPVEDSHVALVAAEAVAAAVAVAAPAAALLVAGLVVPAPAALLVAVPVAPLGAGAASVPLAWSPDGGWLVPPDGVVPPSVMLFVSFVLSPLELVPAGACAAVSGVDACSAGRPGSSPWGLPLPSPPCTVFVPAPEACAPGPSETASSAIATPAPRVRRRAPRSAPLPSGSGSPPGNGCCPGASVATVVVAEARRPRLLGADEGTNSTPWALAMIAPIRSALRRRW